MFISFFRHVLIVMLLIPAIDTLYGQANKPSVISYINTYKNIAAQEMQLYKIPASITLAQGILESGSGTSELARNANNHFGIKCKEEWTGDKYYYDDDAKQECFRKYNSAVDSYRDHSVFLTSRPRYAALFKLDINDYKGWASGLKQAGYATEPRYAEMLIRIIEDNKLYEFDGISEVALKDTVNNSASELPQSSTAIKDTSAVNNAVPDFHEINIGDNGRMLYAINDVRYIKGRVNDTYATIAADFDLSADELFRFNDVKKDHVLSTSEMVFIEPKKNTGSSEFHIVKAGETMHEISQLYGIKLNALYHKNHMKHGAQPTPGHRLYLQKNAPVY